MYLLTDVQLNCAESLWLHQPVYYSQYLVETFTYDI
jgi:hypothetical protein